MKGLLASERLEELLTQEFAYKGTAIEAMRALLRLNLETSGDLGTRAERMATLAFPEEVKNNAVMQVQLTDLYVEVLSDERTRHDVLKEGPLKIPGGSGAG